MSTLRATNIRGRQNGNAPVLPDGAVITGVITATTFSGNITGNVTGDATGLTGTPDISVGTVDATTVSATTVSVAGTITYNDVTNVDSVGVVTARSGIRVGAGQSISAVSGTLKYYGDGSELSGVVSGVEVKSAGSSVGTSLTAINFASGATITTGSAGITTITISAGLTTSAASPTANAIHTLSLDSAQHHTLTLSAGLSTITVAGGSIGDSHSVILIQPSSGICTVGLSTFFQFPSGATPTFSEGSSRVDLLSFIVKQVGAAGTELLTSAGLNYS